MEKGTDAVQTKTYIYYNHQVKAFHIPVNGCGTHFGDVEEEEDCLHTQVAIFLHMKECPTRPFPIRAHKSNEMGGTPAFFQWFSLKSFKMNTL